MGRSSSRFCYVRSYRSARNCGRGAGGGGEEEEVYGTGSGELTNSVMGLNALGLHYYSKLVNGTCFLARYLTLLIYLCILIKFLALTRVRLFFGYFLSVRVG